MKKLLIIIVIFFPCFLHAQQMFNAHVYNTIYDLRASKGTDGVQVQINGRFIATDGLGGSYVWKDTCTQNDDSLNYIKVVSQTGAWVRLKNGNVVKGNATFSGLSLTTSYVVTHNLGFTPAIIIIQPTSLNAAGLAYVSAKSSTTFTVTFITVPVVGTNNISFDWIAIKNL